MQEGDDGVQWKGWRWGPQTDQWGDEHYGEAANSGWKPDWNQHYQSE